MTQRSVRVRLFLALVGGVVGFYVGYVAVTLGGVSSGLLVPFTMGIFTAGFGVSAPRNLFGVKLLGGAVGAVLPGWALSLLFDRGPSSGWWQLPVWLIVVVGAAVLGAVGGLRLAENRGRSSPGKR